MTDRETVERIAYLESEVDRLTSTLEVEKTRNVHLEEKIRHREAELEEAWETLRVGT